MTGGNGRPLIVVGVDGSECSHDALRWAARHAELTGAVLHAVMVWHLPEIYGYVPRDYEADARKALDGAVETALGPDRRAQITTRVVEGHPAAELIEASRGADLLVVGCRGHGGFAGLPLGSVGQHCVGHAECPVVVVRRCPP